MGTGVGFSPIPFLSLLCHARSLSPGEPSALVGHVLGLSPPGDEELYFCTEPFPAPSSLRGRGKYRLRDKPGAAGHSRGRCRPLGLARNPARGRRDPAGRRLLRPRSARAPWSRCGSESSGKGGGIVPSQPQRDFGGNDTALWCPTSQHFGQGDILTLLLRRPHSADEESVRGRARVLANIYSEMQNCLAFLFVIW